MSRAAPAPDRLALEDVAVALGDRPVLRGVSLEVRPGRMVGLLGANGSGKSTMLRAATGLLRPRSGRVMVGGRDMRELPPTHRARWIALLHQSAPLPEAALVRDVVALGRTPHLGWFGTEGVADWAIVEESLAAVELLEFADRRVDALSGGERQRVLVALALAQRTPFLLMDEPTTHLDLRHQLAALELTVGLRRDGVGILAVFHDLNLASRYCDELALLSDGRFRARGAPADVLTPENLRAAYGIDVWVSRHPDDGRPVVLPGRATTPAEAASGR